MTSTTTVLPAILKIDTKGRVRTPASDRDAMMELFEQSGMSGAAFARLHGIRYSTFAHWRKMRRERSPRKPPGHDVPAVFQEVVLTADRKDNPDGLVIDLPQGARVKLERANQIPLIAALCRCLRESTSC